MICEQCGNPANHWPTRCQDYYTIDVTPPVTTTSSSDPVNHPKHYTWMGNGVEVIDVTEKLNFCLGNAVKYILRADHKGNPAQDIQKAIWYLERELVRRSRS